MYLLSRLLGAGSIAFGLYLCLHAYRLLDLRQERISHNVNLPLPPDLRLFGGVAALVFALGCFGYGLRYIVKPIRADEKAF